MQVRRTIMAATLAAVSSLALVAPTLAQAELRGPAPVTGTSGFADELAGGSRMWDGQKVRGEDAVVAYDWDASDPRLTGELTVSYNYDYYERQGLLLASGRSTLGIADGNWVGDARYIGGPDLRGTTTIVLEGQGPYEGLTAHVVVDQDAGPITFSAAIFPGGLPEPPALVQRTIRLGGR